MKASNIMNTVGNRPRPNGLILALIYLYAISSNIVTQECNLMSEKGTFLKVMKQSLMFQNKHNLGEIILMLLLILGINQDIIKVNYHKLANIQPTHMIHQSHECNTSIWKAAGHNQPFIKPFFSLKGCFSLITSSNANLVLTTSNINLWKHLRAM